MIRGVDVVFLHTSSLSELTEWYRDVLGLEAGYGDGHWQEFVMAEGSRFALDGMSDQPSEVERQHTMVSFRVDDIELAMAELRSNGVVFYPNGEGAVFDVGPALVASFQDPEGRWMQLSQQKAP